jgi:hypothetical protein
MISEVDVVIVGAGPAGPGRSPARLPTPARPGGRIAPARTQTALFTLGSEGATGTRFMTDGRGSSRPRLGPEEDTMHPMFVKLFLETDPDDLLVGENAKRPRATLTRHNTPRTPGRGTARRSVTRISAGPRR